MIPERLRIRISIRTCNRILNQDLCTLLWKGIHEQTQKGEIQEQCINQKPMSAWKLKLCPFGTYFYVWTQMGFARDFTRSQKNPI